VCSSDLRIAPLLRGICGECVVSTSAMSANERALSRCDSLQKIMVVFSMDTPENYYAILGVPIDADNDTLKRAYRQLARRYHPDLTGPDGAVEMKRINRAYDVLSDPEKRQHYDTIVGGVIDLRKGGFARSHPRPHTSDATEDIEFAGLKVFSTKGPFRAGPIISTQLGVVSALSSMRM